MSNEEIGYNHWISKRKEFTKNNVPYSAQPNTILDDSLRVKECDMPTIHKSLIEGRKFIKKAPLQFVINVLIWGWKRDGMVPKDFGTGNI